MPEESYNEADKLLQAIRRAKGEPGNLDIDRAWVQAFGLKPGNLSEALKLRAELIDLSEDVARQMRQTLNPRVQHIYLQRLNRIQQGLSLHGHIQWSEATKYFDDDTLDHLETFADTLSKSSPERLVDLEELKAIQQEVEELLETVLNADIEEELREVLLEYLEEVRQAIKDYRLKGIKELKRAVQHSISVVYIGAHYEKEDKGQNETRHHILLRFAGLIKRIATAISPSVLRLSEGAVGQYIKHYIETWLSGGGPPQLGPGSS